MRVKDLSSGDMLGEMSSMPDGPDTAVSLKLGREGSENRTYLLTLFPVDLFPHSLRTHHRHEPSLRWPRTSVWVLSLSYLTLSLVSSSLYSYFLALPGTWFQWSEKVGGPFAHAHEV